MALLIPGRQCGSKAGTRAVCALLAAALTPLPAAAQQQGQARMRTQIAGPATFSNDADMDFGRIMPSTSSGTVVMTPSASPTCTTTGGLVRTGSCSAAAFIGIVLPNADLSIERPPGDRIDLIGPGGATMQLDTFTFGSTAPTLDLGPNGIGHRFQVAAFDGAFLFFVGATLNVAGGQAPGVYNGMFEIRLTYN